MMVCLDRDTDPVHPAVCAAAPSTGRIGMSFRVTTRIGPPPFLRSCVLTSQRRVLAHILYHRGGPRGSHTEYRKNTGTFHAVPAWYPRLGSARPPALAHAWPG